MACYFGSQYVRKKLQTLEVPSFTPYLPRHEAAVFGAPNPARQDGLNFRSKGGLDRLGDTAITSLN